MKQFLTMVLVGTALVAAFCLGGCGSGGSNSSAKGTSLVTISVGKDAKTATLNIERNTLFARLRMYARQALRFSTALAAVPPEVARISIIVTAADMATITEKVPIIDPTATLVVPNGKSRKFTAEAYNIGGKTMYRSPEQVRDLTGEPVTLVFALNNAPLGNQTVLTGAVTDGATGNALADASLTFTPAAGGAPTSTTTSPIGKYALTLDSGDYTVTVSGSPAIALPLTVIANPPKFQELNIRTFPEGNVPQSLTRAAGTYRGWAVSPDRSTNYPFTLTVDGYGNVTGVNTTPAYPKMLTMAGNLSAGVTDTTLTYAGGVYASTASYCATWSGTLDIATGTFAGAWTGDTGATGTWSASRTP